VFSQFRTPSFDSRLTFVLVLAVGVIGSGLLNATLTSQGYETAGSVAWAGGYLLTVVILWHGWGRNLDIGER
jgi:hypothetical protein